MNARNLSLRISLWLPIVIMGLIAIGLVLATAQRYRDITLEDRRAATVELLRIKTDELLQQATARARELALDIQRNKDFRKAFTSRDRAGMIESLNQQFHRYFQTAGVIRMRKLYVFNLAYQPLAESTDKVGLPAGGDRLICNNFIEQASQRSSADQLKVLSGLCEHAGEPLYANLVPIGSLRPSGYLAIIMDPTHSLTGLYKELGMPVRISAAPGKHLHKSPKWPAPDAMQHTMLATYALHNQRNEPLLEVALLTDIRQLEDKLAASRVQMKWVAVLATLLVVAATLFLLQRTTLRPLRRLIDSIRVVQQDRARLGETVHVGGHAEIHELGEAYNRMTVELADLYERLEKLAYRDTLTDLPNRVLFNDRVEQLIAFSERQKNEFALLMMDLDRFKQINDSLGHTVGDLLLQQVAQRLNTTLRHGDLITRAEHDMFARLGGDEFAAVVPLTDGSSAAIAVAKRILQGFKEPFQINNHQLYVGVSIGIAMYPSDGKSLDELMRQADVAMYHAKQTQRSFAFYNTMQDAHSLSILNMEADLRRAIDNNALEVYYQPKVLTDSGAVCGAEALLRWKHPEQGWISPVMFIPIAEQTGLIENLTLWVLEHALADCARWRAAGHLHGVAVNLSAKSLRNDNLPELITALLSNYNLPPGALTLEVTENAIMTDTWHAREILLALHERGIAIALDDFGTGHSSLAHLKQLPVTELKIDKSFVLDMLSDAGDATIVHATIDLGHNLGLQVVAEGVENAAIQKQLQKLHCDICQGFHFARPMPMADWLAYLEARQGNTPASLKLEPGAGG